MDLVCVITGMMFSDAGPLTIVELLKICLSQWLWWKFGVLFSSGIFMCGRSLPGSQQLQFSGRKRKLTGIWLLFKGNYFLFGHLPKIWSFLQYLAKEGKLLVKLEINSGENWPEGTVFLAHLFWLVLSLEMVLALSPLGVSGLHLSGSALAAILVVKHLSEAFQSCVWIPLSFGHVLRMPELLGIL